MTDALAEIDGVKPNVVLAADEERQIKGSGKNPYIIKRRDDHYYCTCPAWRNQKGVATDARTCKHIKSLLGDAYEEARLRMKAGGSAPAPPKPASKKATAGSKRKKPDEDGEPEEDAKPAKRTRKPASKAVSNDDGNDAEEAKPAKRTRKPASEAVAKDADEEEEEGEKPRRSSRKPASKATPALKPASKATPAVKSKAPKKEEEDDNMDVDEDASAVVAQNVPTSDTLEFGGLKPAAHLDDGEEREVKSERGKTVYKVKRTMGHYYCTCPAWRNQSRVKVEVRSCKHLKSLLGEEYEEARTQANTHEDDEAPKTKPPSKSSKPASKASAKPPSTKKPASSKKTKDEEAPSVEKEDTINEEEEEESSPPGGDELAEINGLKPKVYMKDGETQDVKSQSSNTSYKVKRTWDHYYCSCPAWRNQGGAPVNARTCKHLKSLLGDKYEEARIKKKNPDGPAPAAKKKPASRKKKGDADDDDDDDDAGASSKAVPKLLLANKWDLEKGADPTGWWISEKLDGVRTFYDGKGMISRLGNPFTPPQWLLEKLPKDVTLDGELFGGRKNFQDTVSIVKTVNSPHWKNITFQIFDIPSSGSKPFEDRIAELKKLFGPGGSHECKEVVVVEHEKAEGRDHVLGKLKEIEDLGGEGLMLRKPGSKYEGTRSSSLLKIKTFHDAEAEVIGYAAGKGKHTGATGALQCRMESGKTFNVGTGLSDKQRKNPPKIGSIITYRFQELTRDLVPRFPSFIGEAVDKDKAKDAVLTQIQKAADPEDDEDADEH